MDPTRLRSLTVIGCAAALWAGQPASAVGEGGAALGAVEQEIKRVKATPQLDDDVRLAAQLLEASETAKDKPAIYLTLLDHAYNLAHKSRPGYPTALTALERQLPSRRGGQRVAALQRIADLRYRQFDAALGAERATLGDKGIRDQLRLAEAHGLHGDGDAMARVYEQASKLAKSMQSPLQSAIVSRRMLVSQSGALEGKLARRDERIRELQTQLEGSPDDPDAQRALGLFYLTDMDDPVSAARYLAANDARTPRRYLLYASGAAKPVADEQWLKLAHWYEGLTDLAESPKGRANMYARALRYCKQFLLVHTERTISRREAQTMADRLSPLVEQFGFLGADGQWVGVLYALDVAKDAIGPTWRRTGASVTSPADESARAIVGVIPEGDYELQATFRRPRRDTAARLYLPLGGRALWLTLGGGEQGDVHRLESIEGTTDATQTSGLAVSQPHTVRVSVRRRNEQADVRVTLNGKALLAWRGPVSRAALPDDGWMPSPRTLGVGATGGGVEFSDVQLHMLNGKAQALRTDKLDAVDPTPRAVTSAGAVAQAPGLDLLPFVKPDLDIVRGRWTKTDKGLKADARDKARITLPVAPKGHYELRASFTCQTHCEGVQLILPVGETAAMVTVNGWLGYVSGIEAIDRQRANSNPTRLRTRPLRKDQRYTLAATVLREATSVTIEVTLDGRPYLRWRGELTSLTLPRGYEMPYRQLLGVGAHNTRVVFDTVELRMLAGLAEPLRKEGDEGP